MGPRGGDRAHGPLRPPGARRGGLRKGDLHRAPASNVPVEIEENNDETRRTRQEKNKKKKHYPSLYSADARIPAPLRHFLPLLCEHFTSLLFATFRLKRRINMTGMKNAASTWLPCFSLFKPTQCFAKAHDTVLVQTLAGGAGSNHMSIGACLAGVNYGVRA